MKYMFVDRVHVILASKVNKNIACLFCVLIIECDNRIFHHIYLKMVNDNQFVHDLVKSAQIGRYYP